MNVKPGAPKPDEAALAAGRWGALALGMVVGVFAVVRLFGMFNDLWLDEIWSVKMVETIKSPWEILTVLRHDNNHPLNSLFIYALLPTDTDWTYRLFSWFTGSLSVWLAALIARRQYQQLHPGAAPSDGAMAGLLMAVLFGGAYLLIHYSSEARGYAPAVMFSLLAGYALQHTGDVRWKRWAVIYTLSCALGLLSHLATVQVMIAGAGLTGLEILRDRAQGSSRLRQAVCWHVPAWVGFAAYYYGFVRKMEIGGGPENPLVGVLGEVAAYVLGLPVSTGLAVALPLLVSLIVIGLYLMVRGSGWRFAVYYGLLIFVTPALGLVFSKFTLLFPRYFIVSAAFALVPVGYVLARLWHHGGWGRIAVVTGLGLFLAGNGVHVARLVHDGRGQYRAALRDIAAHATSFTITIGSDHEARNFALIHYYRDTVNPKQFVYFPVDQRPSRGVDWLLLHRLDGDPEPPPLIADARGHRYAQGPIYRHAALSGWDWYVYQRE